MLANGSPVGAGSRVLYTVSTLTVAFNEEMSVDGGTSGAGSVTNPANWDLTRDGTPAGSHISAITFGYNASASRYEATLTLAPARD